MYHEQTKTRRMPQQSPGFLSTLLLIVIALVVVAILGVGVYVAVLQAKLPRGGSSGGL